MRNIAGLAIVLLGLGFLLQQFNLPWADDVMSTWWAFVIIAVGLLSWSGNRRMWFGSLIIVGVGVILVLEQLNLVDQSMWSFFWPVVIILFGARIIMGRSWGQPTVSTNTEASTTVFFSGADKKVTGDVTRANVAVWFGGAKIDLRQAHIKPEAVIEIFTAFGGIELFVPTGVRVVSNVVPLFGGVDDKTTPDQATVTLHLTGTALFGGVGIKNA